MVTTTQQQHKGEREPIAWVRTSLAGEPTGEARPIYESDHVTLVTGDSLSFTAQRAMFVTFHTKPLTARGAA